MDSFSIALSGMQAAQTQMNIVAQNVANLNTPGNKSRNANLVAGAAGVSVGSVTLDSSPGPIQPDGTEGSNVDLGTQMVNQIVAAQYYRANASVISISNKTYGSLLDILHTN